MATTPAAPAEAAPEERDTDPELPTPVEAPLPNATVPLTTPFKADADPMLTEPLLLVEAEPIPLRTLTEPPPALMLAPACTETSPPSPPEAPTPAASETAPPHPAALLPAVSETSPPEAVELPTAMLTLPP